MAAEFFGAVSLLLSKYRNYVILKRYQEIESQLRTSLLSEGGFNHKRRIHGR